MRVIAHQGDSLDTLCWRHLGTSNELVAVLEANPGLAAIGPILPEGTVVDLPERTETAPPVVTTIQLWD